MTDAHGMTDEDWRTQLANATSRIRIGDSGKSGASIDRVVLPSGITVVVKQCSRDSDWVIQLTRDEGRLGVMWAGGVFDRLPASIDHTMLALLQDDNGWQIVMRDVGTSFVADDQALSRDQVHRALVAVDEMHGTFRGERIEGACPLDDYLRVYLPVEPKLFPGWVTMQEAQWSELKQNVTTDVADLVGVVLDDPPAFFSGLFERCEQTLIHGDLFPPNLGFSDDRVVLIDWSFATIAPAAFEMAFFLLWSDCGWCATLDVPRDEVLEYYQSIAGDRCDAESLSIGLIAAFALSGVALRDRPDALEWWTQRIGSELKRTRLP